MERLAKFVPTLNIPQIIALKAVPGRMVSSNFGTSEVAFDLTDGRPWYVPQVIADEMYRSGIVARQQIQVTATGRKKTELRIVPVQYGERDYTPELEQSLANRQRERATAGSVPISPAATVRNGAETANTTSTVHTNGTAPARRAAEEPPPLPPWEDSVCPSTAKTMATRLCASMCVLIDAMAESKAYAQRRGIDLTNEDLRCLVTTSYISECKGGR